MSLVRGFTKNKRLSSLQLPVDTGNSIPFSSNTFHQRKWSRTIDLNTLLVILFKSPRDLHQFDLFGKQLEQLDLVREAYERATTSPFGHSPIDFDLKTNDVLRFFSNTVAPQATTFYFPSSTAKELLLTDGLAETY